MEGVHARTMRKVTPKERLTKTGKIFWEKSCGVGISKCGINVDKTGENMGKISNSNG
jgi:hypothetical protein